MTGNPVGSPLRFNFPQVTYFSLSNSCLTDQTEQREYETHTIKASMTVRWV